MRYVLSDIASINAGHPFRGTIPESKRGEARVVRIRDIDEYDQVLWKNLIPTKISGRKRPDWLRDGDILFLARGNKNRATLVDAPEANVLCAPHFFIIRVTNDLIQPAFLAWQLNQLPAQKYFSKSAQGTAIASIPRSFLAATPLIIPSLDKQRLITEMAAVHLKEKQTMQAMIANRDMQMFGVANKLLTTSLCNE